MSDTSTLSGSPSMVAMVLVIAFGIGIVMSLANSRARPYVLGLIGLGVGAALIAMLFDRPNYVVPGHETPVNTYPVEMQRLQAEHLTEAQRAHAEHMAEIIRNQRLAARMADAVLQQSPDYTYLETYPDGMQIKQDPTGHRIIVREADSHPDRPYAPTGPGTYQSVVNTRMAAVWWILAMPIVLLFVMFLVVRNRKVHGGWGPALALLLIAGALILGGGFVSVRGSRTHVLMPTPVPSVIAKVPVVHAPSEPPALFDDAANSVDGPQPQADPIEAMWNSLTGPKIKLDMEKAIDGQSREELATAARTILAASAPGADPFTQGWLANAAKAILKAAAEEGKKDPLSLAGAMEEPIAQYAAQQHEQRKDRDEAAAHADSARPAWIDNPQTQAPNTRRLVVSTDSLNTVEECQDQLTKRLRYAVAERLRELVVQATGQWAVDSPMLADMGISPEYIVRELCPEPVYIETVGGSSGKMKRAHALLEFTPLKDQALFQRWRTATRTHGSGPVQAGVSAAKIYHAGERPAWVDQPPQVVGNTQRIVVTTDPYSTAEECIAPLHAKLLSEVQAQIGKLARDARAGASVESPNPEWLGINSDYILQELCPEGVYIETLDLSVGPMKRAHALLEFNDAQNQFLLNRWSSYARQENMAIVALMAAGLGGCLSLAYGLLKVDTWTRGYYSKRLFIGVPAAIIATGVMFIAIVEIFH